MVKNLPACSAGGGLYPCVRKIPWKRKWQPTPVFLPGEFHGQRSLVDYSPWGPCKESDMTERLSLSCRVLIRINGVGHGVACTKYSSVCLPAHLYTIIL